MQFPLKAQAQDGSQCHETGVKIGRAIHISMDKVSHFQLLLVMAGDWFHTMLLLLVGLSVKLILVGSFTNKVTSDVIIVMCQSYNKK